MVKRVCIDADGKEYPVCKNGAGKLHFVDEASAKTALPLDDGSGGYFIYIDGQGRRSFVDEKLKRFVYDEDGDRKYTYPPSRPEFIHWRGSLPRKVYNDEKDNEMAEKIFLRLQQLAEDFRPTNEDNLEAYTTIAIFTLYRMFKTFGYADCVFQDMYKGIAQACKEDDEPFKMMKSETSPDRRKGKK